MVFRLECESREPDLAAVRTCRIVSRLEGVDRDDYWLAEVTPAIIGQHFGLGADMLNEVILATRFKGSLISDASRNPTPVYVARIVGRNALTVQKLMRHQIEVILWGMLGPA